MAQLVARLVRNEKVGGSNPPSSTTGRHPIRMSVFCMPVSGVAVPGCRVACGAAGVPGAAWGPGCLMCPWAAARPRAVRAASFARRVVSKPGQAPPPPTGTAAWPSGPSTPAALWCCVADVPGQAPPLPFTPVRPGVLVCSERHLDAWTGPAAAHGHRSHALRSLRRPPHQWCLWWVIGQNVLVLW